jgi:polyhydroxyalkanoate synthesis repressor PhaR
VVRVVVVQRFQRGYMADDKDRDGAPVTIKKYANRRLYNTDTSSYVTLEYLCQMIKDGIDFVVYDAKSGEDITRSVLTQIIVEEEAKGQNLLPLEFLRQLIGCYGDAVRGSILPDYLEQTMASFVQNQAEIRDAVRDTLGGALPIDRFEEIGAKNMAVFEQAMSMFNPFGGGAGGNGAKKAQKTPKSDPEDDQIDALTQKLNALQAQIDQLNKSANR